MNFWTKLATGSFLVASMTTISACRTVSPEPQAASLKDQTSTESMLLNQRYVRINQNYEDSFSGAIGNYTDGIRLEMTRTLGCDLEPTAIRIAMNNGEYHVMHKLSGTQDSSTWTRYIPRPVGLPRPIGGDGSLPVGMPMQPDDTRPVGLPMQPDDTRPVGLPMPSDDDTRPAGMPVQPDVTRPIGLPMPISISQFTIYFQDNAEQARGCYVRIYDFEQSSVRPVGLPMPQGGDEVRPVGLPMPQGGDEVRPVGLPIPQGDDDEVRPVGLPMPSDDSDDARPVGLPRW